MMMMAVQVSCLSLVVLHGEKKKTILVTSCHNYDNDNSTIYRNEVGH